MAMLPTAKRWRVRRAGDRYMPVQWTASLLQRTLQAQVGGQLHRHWMQTARMTRRRRCARQKRPGRMRQQSLQRWQGLPIVQVSPRSICFGMIWILVV